MLYVKRMEASKEHRKLDLFIRYRLHEYSKPTTVKEAIAYLDNKLKRNNNEQIITYSSISKYS